MWVAEGRRGKKTRQQVGSAVSLEMFDWDRQPAVSWPRWSCEEWAPVEASRALPEEERVSIRKGLTSRRVRVGGVVCAAAMIAALGGSGLVSTTAASAATHYKIFMISKGAGNPYFEAAQSGASAAAKQWGDTLVFDSPADATAAEQVTIIDTAIAEHANGIIFSADDPNAVAGALENAMKAGIKVISYDADVAAPARSLFVNQATYSAIGGSLVKAMCAEIPGCAGDIAFLSESPDSPNLSQWVAAAKSALKLPIYSKLKVVETAYCGDSDAPCYADTQALMKAHPKLKGIIVPGSVQLAAAARALTDLSLVGKVQMTGLGLPIQLKSYVLSGLMKDVVFWNVINLGYLAEWVEHGLLAGTITPKIGETFRAGKLGSFFVEANHMILLGGTDCKTDLTCGLLLFNKKNIGSVTY